MRTGLTGVLMVLAAMPAAAEVRLENGWVRAMPPVSDTTAAYGRIVNDGATPVTIKAAPVDWAERVMLHATTEGPDGTSGMRHLESVPVPAGGSVTLQSGDKHLMFTGVDSVPRAGSNVPVCIRVDAERHCTNLPVRGAAPE
jgi:copper(I)-binding protein